MIKSVVFIGAGNVATNFAKAVAKEFEIKQIYSRTEESAYQLATLIGCDYTTNKELIAKADLYICSVKDDAIEDAIKNICFENSILVHTAGSVSISVLKEYATQYGVLYPMQSFSKIKPVDWSKLTIYIEANNKELENDLVEFVNKIGSNYSFADSEKRGKLHIAAVLVSNFTNELYAIADRLLTEQGLDFNAMLPLIDETVNKIHTIRPQNGQTGPAIRRDQKILDLHISKLNGIDKEIYKLLSLAIQQEPPVIK